MLYVPCFALRFIKGNRSVILQRPSICRSVHMNKSQVRMVVASGEECSEWTQGVTCNANCSLLMPADTHF